MKKTLSIVSALILLLSLAACTAKDTKESMESQSMTESAGAAHSSVAEAEKTAILEGTLLATKVQYCWLPGECFYDWENAIQAEEGECAPVLPSFGYSSISEMQAALEQYYPADIAGSYLLNSSFLVDGMWQEDPARAFPKYKEQDGKLYYVMPQGENEETRGLYMPNEDYPVEFGLVSRNGSTAVIAFTFPSLDEPGGKGWHKELAHYTLIDGKIINIELVNDNIPKDDTVPENLFGKWIVADGNENPVQLLSLDIVSLAFQNDYTGIVTDVNQRSFKFLYGASQAGSLKLEQLVNPDTNVWEIEVLGYGIDGNKLTVDKLLDGGGSVVYVFDRESMQN